MRPDVRIKSIQISSKRCPNCRTVFTEKSVVVKEPINLPYIWATFAGKIDNSKWPNMVTPAMIQVLKRVKRLCYLKVTVLEGSKVRPKAAIRRGQNPIAAEIVWRHFVEAHRELRKVVKEVAIFRPRVHLAATIPTKL